MVSHLGAGWTGAREQHRLHLFQLQRRQRDRHRDRLGDLCESRTVFNLRERSGRREYRFTADHRPGQAGPHLCEQLLSRRWQWTLDHADIAEYTISNPTTTDFKQYNGRLDADVTSKDHLSFAIYWVPDSLSFVNGGLGYHLFNHSQVNDAFSLIWNHTFSPTFLNEARANAAGWRYNELTSNPQAPFGLPQDSVTTIGNQSLGNISVGSPGVYDQWTYGYKDVATKVLHTHTMKFGFELTRLYYLNDPIGKPNYTFYNLWDFLNDAPEAEGGPFQATTGIPGGYRNDNRENILGIFFQDDWKVRPNLTLTAGLR